MKSLDGSLVKKNIITIAGRPGSGKSTTAKAAARQLGFEHFSSGDFFRELGKQKGIDVLLANASPGVTEELDRLVDGKLREIGAKGDRMVIDSRTAWHWIPGSFKVFLNLDLESAARRILNEINEERQNSEKIHENPIDYAKALKKRLDAETERYKAIYGIDPYEMSNYDLVIDTESNSIEQVIEKVINEFSNWLKR
ncbi:MAG TPA: cytidylate kinase family protein [Candidatus Saccharimonadales bacterium]|nr:cytidylate kinase family protein [Candidatus Saccharimonadales bacterium]